MKSKVAESFKELRYGTLTQQLLFLTIIATNLGEVINIFGLKFSWIFAGLTLTAFIYELFTKRITFSLNNTHLRIIAIFFIFWIFYATVQMVFIDRNASAYTFYKFLAGNIFIVLMMVLNTKSLDDILFFCKALIVGYLINLLIAIWEILTCIPVVDAEVTPGYAYGVFANMNDLCTVFAFGIFLLILNLLLKKINVRFTVAIIILSFFIIIMDNSRASMLSLFALFSFWGLFRFAQYLYGKQKKYFVWFLSATLGIPLVAAIIILCCFSLSQIVQFLGSDSNAISNNLRVELTEKAVAILKDSNYLGVGPGQSVELAGINLHNFFLEILAEYGVLIFAGLLYIFAVIFTAFKSKLSPWISSFLMAFIPFFTVVSISSSSAAKIKATWVIITLMFLTVVLSAEGKKHTVAASQQVEKNHD